jgi:hypothetical protein
LDDLKEIDVLPMAPSSKILVKKPGESKKMTQKIIKRGNKRDGKSNRRQIAKLEFVDDAES